ncbi:MAG: DUF1214 domain-containing protein [Chloroflexi bacterium]|nr:DUF1214 domain-containing protein [Chloroflexota bacterium]
MSNHSSKSAQAYNKLVDTLREAREVYFDPKRGIVKDIDIIEGYRYLLHLASAGIDFYLEGNPEHPEFVKMVSPIRKFGGDNPDAIYHFTRIRGDRSYRITGKRGRECYLSFTVHGRIAEEKLGLAAEPVLADVNDRNMKIAPDGSFEVILSPEEHRGNWIQLQPTAASVIVRHYFELEKTVADDLSIEVKLKIEPLGPPSVRPPMSDDDIARRIRDVTAFVRGGSIELIDMASLPVPFVSRVPNELPQPSVFRTSGQASWGAVDIAYAMAPFLVQPDEALIMEGRLPRCAFANVVLWNRHMQSFEFRDRRVSLNRVQMKRGRDDSYRIVIAHKDPGVPNWLDTEGHTGGSIFWRFLLPEGQMEKPKCTLVPLSEVSRK